ncbi:MAG: hypothetical protein KAW41_01660 [Candidatus Diapherotrites archaeon]|nr:hypothetical protein [Candidatus Diapherotrites archaeon]
MKVVGDLRGLEKAVKQRYRSDAKSLESEARARTKKIRDWQSEQVKEIKRSRKARLESVRETAKRRVVNEARMKARMEYQREKEKHIASVVAEARKGLKKLSESEEYMSYVKRHLPKVKGYTAYCGSPKYKDIFGDKMKPDKAITGVKIVAGDTAYDFTLDSLMDSRISEVKMAASKALFEE